MCFTKVFFYLIIPNHSRFHPKQSAARRHVESVESLNVCIFFFYNLNESVVSTDHLIIKIESFHSVAFLFSPTSRHRFLVFVYRALFLQSHLIYNLFFYYYFICFSSIVFCRFLFAASAHRSSWQCWPDSRSDERTKDWIFSVFTLLIIVECAVYFFISGYFLSDFPPSGFVS